MDRLTRELHEADKRAQIALRSEEELAHLLDAALALAIHCYRLYEGATKHERRMFNQGFFTRLYIAQDGSVDHAELQEPFVQLLAHDEMTIIERRTSGHEAIPADGIAPGGTDTTASGPLSRGENSAVQEARHRDAAVWVSIDKKNRTQLTLGSNKHLLAGALPRAVAEAIVGRGG